MIIGKIIYPTISSKDKVEKYQQVIRDAEWHAIRGYLSANSKILDVWSGAGYSLMKAYEDLDCIVEGIDADPRIYGVIYSFHNSNKNNISNNPYKRQLKSLNVMFNNTEIKIVLAKKIKNKKLSNCHFGIAQYHLLSNNLFEMRISVLKSTLLFPFAENIKHKIYILLKGNSNDK